MTVHSLFVIFHCVLIIIHVQSDTVMSNMGFNFYISSAAFLLFALLHYICALRNKRHYTKKPSQETNPDCTSELVLANDTNITFGRSIATEERNRDTGGEMVLLTSSVIVRPAVTTSQIMLHGMSIAVQERSTDVSTELVTGIA